MPPQSSIILMLILVTILPSHVGASAINDNKSTNSSSNHGIVVAAWNIEHVKDHIAVTLLIVAVLVVKLLYSYSEKLATYLPESCVLILIGVCVGAVLRWGLKIQSQQDIWELTPNLFLFVLLPPIILEAAHHLCCRAFLDVFFPVIFFAVIGTVLNFLIIGMALYHTNRGGWMGFGAPSMNQTDCFLFASVMVAVDPVAVLAIFQEIRVDKLLYFYVFGESLFNDAVTIVLFYLMEAFMKISNPSTVDIVLGIVSFFTVSLGGAGIGLIFGILTSLFTRLTRHCRILEPVVIITIAYLSYLVGDMVKWSGIISIISCGMVQASYAFHNMSPKSLLTTRRVLKTLANFCEAIIFIDLGVALIRKDHYWVYGFILWSLFIILLARFIVTFASSWFLNKTGLLIKKISLTEQFVMGYGGLRGAVAFTLVSLINAEIMKNNNIEKDMFLTTALVIIIFTILFMGISIQPLVKLLKVKLEESKGLSIFTELGNNACDHFAAGMEAIEGRTGRNAFRARLEYFDTHYIRRVLQNDPESYDEKIVKVYEKVSLVIHYATVKNEGESAHYLDKLSSPLRTRLKNCNSQITLSHPEVACENERMNGRPGLPGVSTMINMTENYLAESADDMRRRRRRSSNTSIRSTSDYNNRTITSDNYSEILRFGITRPNAVAKQAPKEEDFLNRVRRNLNLRTEAYVTHTTCRHHHHAKHFTDLPRRRTNSFGEGLSNGVPNDLEIPMRRVRTKSLNSVSSDSEVDPDLRPPKERSQSLTTSLNGTKFEVETLSGQDNPVFILDVDNDEPHGGESTDEVTIVVTQH